MTGTSHAEGSTSVAALVEQAAHLLPEQSPLHTFVHHNTLHAFEHLPFEQAVVEAGRIFGTQPFQTEEAFRRHLDGGRILVRDLEAVLEEDGAARASGGRGTPPGPSRGAYRLLRLQNLFEIPRGAALEWQLGESELLERVHPLVDAARRRELEHFAERRHGDRPRGRRLAALLEELWETLARAACELPARDDGVARVRRRDQLVAVGAPDVDDRVHPLLIRTAAAFLDQGVASWPMPERELGYLRAFRRLYGQHLPAPERWARGLARELRQQEEQGLDAEHTALRALELLGVAEDEREAYVRATLLSLRGWAGMMHQFELRPDRAPVEPRPARLLEFLAVQLVCEAFAARTALAEHLGRSASWSDLARALPPAPRGVPVELVYEGFVMAQIAGIDLEDLGNPLAARAWLEEVSAFDELERRRLLHRAFERRLRIQLLDGIAASSRAPRPAAPAPGLQALFCIDDRECSTRRHLEEVLPDVRTYGAAGFFGVAMAWQGLGEVQSRPLCPVNVRPTHYVTERALRPEEEQAWSAARRRRGLAEQAMLRGSRGLAGGGLLSTLLGWWTAIPMIGRCLFPRLSERLASRLARPDHLAPATRLVLERRGDERDAQGRWIGYSTGEMADVVEGILRTVALTSGFCELVLVIGHGSSSLNNPHGAAYDCGATGGGRGGPNARAFAAMANHPAVRAELARRGILIPEGTWFVGSYHNTCDDSMTWYDEDLMPDARQPALERVKEHLADACALDAHERARRFESAPHGADPLRALRHVAGRSVDMAQPRPECGHATNAFAIVGRRDRTRGLFLDRRAFLVSYDPTTDPDGGLLERLLGAVVPVGAGINLEYYFSYVDPSGYGCGSKLPHNITGLIGVMDGHSSDLRTGLPWQMVEIHEPVRLLAVVEATPERLTGILARNPGMEAFLRNGWIQLAAWSPDDDRIWEYVDGAFVPYRPESSRLPRVPSSPAFYRDERDHLGCALVGSQRDIDLHGGAA